MAENDDSAKLTERMRVLGELSRNLITAAENSEAFGGTLTKVMDDLKVGGIAAARGTAELAAKINEYEKRVQQLRENLLELGISTKQVDKVISSLDKELKKVSADFNTLYQQLKEGKISINEFVTSMGGWGNAISALGKKFTEFVTGIGAQLAILAFLAKQFKDFTVGAAQVANQMRVTQTGGPGGALPTKPGDVGRQLAAAQELTAFGKALGFTTEEVSGLARQFGDLGIGVEGIHTSMMAMRVFGMSSEQAGKLTQQFSRQFGLAGERLNQSFLTIAATASSANLPIDMVARATEELIQAQVGHTSSLKDSQRIVFGFAQALNNGKINIQEFQQVVKAAAQAQAGASKQSFGKILGFAQLARQMGVELPETMKGKTDPFQMIGGFLNASPAEQTRMFLQVSDKIAKQIGDGGTKEGRLAAQALVTENFGILPQDVTRSKQDQFEITKKTLEGKGGIKKEEETSKFKEAMSISEQKLEDIAKAVGVVQGQLGNVISGGAVRVVYTVGEAASTMITGAGEEADAKRQAQNALNKELIDITRAEKALQKRPADDPVRLKMEKDFAERKGRLREELKDANTDVRIDYLKTMGKVTGKQALKQIGIGEEITKPVSRTFSGMFEASKLGISRLTNRVDVDKIDPNRKEIAEGREYPSNGQRGEGKQRFQIDISSAPEKREMSLAKRQFDEIMEKLKKKFEEYLVR
jgi:coenzyme F420-reducing hydrogenase delta subunit